MKIQNEVSEQIWKDRYDKNDGTLENNLKRVSTGCAKNPQEEQEFYNVMDKGYFFPAGRTMSNVSVGQSLTLNNCFVANFVEDSIEDIFDKVKLGALTHKRGGGIGYEFSKIRPNGTPTSNDAIASGVVSFMHVFNAQTACILQGGRRGANMGILSIYHPDIYEYLDAKSFDAGTLVHFNLSIMVDDNFMKAVKENTTIDLHYPVYDDEGKMITDESKWTIRKPVNARELWDLIMQKAYNTGEYGVFFYDNINRDNNTAYIEQIIGTNPCGEYLAGMLHGRNPFDGLMLVSEDYKGACNLGSVFLHYLVKEPFTKNARIDEDALKQAVYTGVKFLDNIIDINKFPHITYENYQKNMRTIGLGVTGLADALVMLNMKYGSPESVTFVDKLMNQIAKYAYRASIELAKERGNFPFLDREKYIQSGYIQKHIEFDADWYYIAQDILKYGIRNARILSIAPTGTLSLAYGNNCSSGEEPIFALEGKRKVKMGGQDESNIQIVTLYDYAYKLWLNRKISSDCIVTEDKFVTALELSVHEHLSILKVVAFHTDMSVSKTINIPVDYSFEKTKEVYEWCHANGIKGCTIFRPNPLRQGIMITEDKEKETKQAIAKTEIPILERGFILEASDDLIGRKRKLMTGCGSLHLQAWFDPDTGNLLEIFCSKGSEGGCNSFMIGLSRMTSLALRAGTPIEAVIDQLKSVPSCTSYGIRTATKKDTSKGSCCPVAIGNILKEMQKDIWDELGIEDEIDNTKIVKVKKESTPIEIKQEKEIPSCASTSCGMTCVGETKPQFTPEELDYIKTNGEIAYAKHYNKCPLCGTVLENSSGCLTCPECGWSKCG